jgi:hypothetical protein
MMKKNMILKHSTCIYNMCRDEKKVHKNRTISRSSRDFNTIITIKTPIHTLDLNKKIKKMKRC